MSKVLEISAGDLSLGLSPALGGGEPYHFCARQSFVLAPDRLTVELGVTYCDPARTDFCLEPQTHAVGALNRLGSDKGELHGLKILEPGASMSGAIAFLPFRLT